MNKTILLDAGGFVGIENESYRDAIFDANRTNHKIQDKIVSMIGDRLDYVVIVPEEGNLLASQRIRRINRECDRLGSDNCLLLSLRTNVRNNGMDHGITMYSNCDITDKLYNIVTDFADSFVGNDFYVNTKHGDPYIKSGHKVSDSVKCDTIVFGNLFSDNLDDFYIIAEDENIDKLAKAYVEALSRYYKY